MSARWATSARGAWSAPWSHGPSRRIFPSSGSAVSSGVSRVGRADCRRTGAALCRGWGESLDDALHSGEVLLEVEVVGVDHRPHRGVARAERPVLEEQPDPARLVRDATYLLPQERAHAIQRAREPRDLLGRVELRGRREHPVEQGADEGVFGPGDAYTPVKVNDDGRASASTTLPLETPTGGSYFVSVRASAANVEMTVACGNLAPPTQ